jgi:hypothetical protein
VLYQSDGIFLLFSGGVDIGKKKRVIMATNQSHEAPIIKLICASFLLLVIRCLMGFFTFVDSFIRNPTTRVFRGLSALRFYTATNLVYLRFRKEVLRIIKGKTIARRAFVSMMEVSVDRNMYVPATIINSTTCAS